MSTRSHELATVESIRRNPELRSLAAILKAMGLRIAIQPLQPTRR